SGCQHLHAGRPAPELLGNGHELADAGSLQAPGAALAVRDQRERKLRLQSLYLGSAGHPGWLIPSTPFEPSAVLPAQACFRCPRPHAWFWAALCFVIRE